MNTKPYNIVSNNFQFVIVGPFPYREGVIVRSSKADIELVGMAKLLYSSSAEGNLKNNEISLRNTSISLLNKLSFDRQRDFDFCWSKSVNYITNTNDINVESRNIKFLLVWESDFDRNRKVGNKDYLIREFNYVAFDLASILFSEKYSHDDKVRHIEWYLSSLVLIGSSFRLR